MKAPQSTYHGYYTKSMSCLERRFEPTTFWSWAKFSLINYVEKWLIAKRDWIVKKFFWGFYFHSWIAGVAIVVAVTAVAIVVAVVTDECIYISSFLKFVYRMQQNFFALVSVISVSRKKEKNYNSKIALSQKNVRIQSKIKKRKSEFRLFSLFTALSY